MSHYVSFIGAGNLAWHLAPALDNAGYAVREVYSRTPRTAKELVNRLYQAEAKSDLDFSDSDAHIFIVAVSDDAIMDVAREVILPENAILVHTSGAKPISALSYAASNNIGVFYPLQTFTKAKKVDFNGIPVCIEAENTGTERELMKMGEAISKKVLQVNSKHRKALHVAAVFACNFTNHFFKIAKDILSASDLDFELLHPLIIETVQKSLAIGPDNAQTGPAKRQDMETLDEHMEYLQHSAELAELYRMISQHIIDTYPKE
ncbi:hypothetical protein C900_02789 [Fulvivirga imtechensis AK7]|uniref:DUF2520 domain-containing protein n=1 Tax=Fulvivirga imtechensis AK7 TaxID=1237149 RepID=L8JT99_9BACT|nr:Rossmann-like and DUF2520 domain-containing protein [Fulvivirga imtechensis]ELR71448.1 hypothetical protein C900_02789 [Fulvivirga imtechensis AK7]